jgi:hypothetical protein
VGAWRLDRNGRVVDQVGRERADVKRLVQNQHGRSSLLPPQPERPTQGSTTDVARPGKASVLYRCLIPGVFEQRRQPDNIQEDL